MTTAASSGFVLSPGTPGPPERRPCVPLEYLYLQVTWSALPKITVVFLKDGTLGYFEHELKAISNSLVGIILV